MHADILLKQDDQFKEKVTYRLQNIRLFDDSKKKIPKIGEFKLHEWYYDAPHHEFVLDHKFQIVVIRSGEEQEYINGFEEAIDYLSAPRDDIDTRDDRDESEESDEMW